MNIREAIDKYDRKTSQYIVAYLDILGASSRMSQNIDSQLVPLNKLHNLYVFVTELTEKSIGIKLFKGIRFKIFSDNIIIAKKLSSDPSERIKGIFSLLNCVSHFQISSVGVSVGWLVRGGITIGDFFIDNTMVWGPALLRAYELENNIAIYPRVVIDHDIISELNSNKEASDYLLLDFDGVTFLNYMCIWHYAGVVVKGGFEKMKMEVKKIYNSYPDKVYQKLYWHMNYVNCELDKKKEKQDKNYRLSLD
jgi:hypothetical protein